MESRAELSSCHNLSTVRGTEERRAAKKQRNHWLIEANWPRQKEDLVNSRYPYFRGQCDEDCLELGFDPVLKQTLFNVLRRIDGKLITYENAF